MVVASEHAVMTSIGPLHDGAGCEIEAGEYNGYAWEMFHELLMGRSHVRLGWVWRMADGIAWHSVCKCQPDRGVSTRGW